MIKQPFCFFKKKVSTVYSCSNVEKKKQPTTTTKKKPLPVLENNSIELKCFPHILTNT